LQVPPFWHGLVKVHLAENGLAVVVAVVVVVAAVVVVGVDCVMAVFVLKLQKMPKKPVGHEQ